MSLLIKRRRPAPAKIFLIFNLVLIIFVFFQGGRPNAYRPLVTAKNLAYYNGRSLKLSGRVCEEADLDYKSRRLTICVGGSISGQVLVSLKLYPEYDYGDYLEITGRLEAPPKIEGFDYESYLARYDIYSVMYYPKASLKASRLNLGQKIYRRLLDFKQGIAKLINQSLPEPEAGLASALLLGYRRTVSQADLKIFARVGLSHLIAISGSHITILSAMLLNFLLFSGFNRRQSLRLIFGFLFLYPIITGLAASALRSSIMGALALLAVYYERVSSLIKALVFAAAAMLIFNPRLLRSDIGFQLSFLALLGIIYVYPLGERLSSYLLDKIQPRLEIKTGLKNVFDIINLTLVSQVMILPIALIDFRQLSLIAPLANILVLWTFPPLLSALIIGSALSSLWPAASVLFFMPAYFLLKFIFFVSSYLASFSGAALNVSGFTWYFGGVYYLFLIILVKLLRKRFLEVHPGF